MRGVAARHPAFDKRVGKPVALGARINVCRQHEMKLPPLAAESDELLGMESFLGWLSRGVRIAPPADQRLEAGRSHGQTLWRQRFGQLDFSCAQCHDSNAGRRLAGSVIPQGHATGYPIYRLEWQGMGSLQRRLSQLHGRCARRAVRFRQRRVHGHRDVPDAARCRHARRDAGGAAMTSAIEATRPGSRRR
jgi:sulfur-oxidizing protein SoxA